MREDTIEGLEKEIDRLTADLPALKNFVYPGESLIGAKCAIARTVCRRAERDVVRLGETSDISESIIKYLNRLSDYLFTLERIFNEGDEVWKK